jgi:hypothetical protein
MDRMEPDPGKAEVHTHLGLGPNQHNDGVDALEDLSRAGRSGAMGQARDLADGARDRARGAFGRATSELEERAGGVLSLAREHPLATIGVAFAVGFMVAGTSDSGGRFGKAKQQLRGAIIGAISAAVAQEARSFAEGTGLLASLFGRGEEEYEEEDEPAPRRTRRPRQS